MAEPTRPEPARAEPARPAGLAPIIAAVLSPTRLVTAVCAALVLGIAAPAGASASARAGASTGTPAGPSAEAPPGPGAQAEAAAAAPPVARLKVAVRRPLQLHGTLLDASGSTGDIRTYIFHFGDGIVEQSYQPLALHGYRNPGSYHASVTVVDGAGRQSTSASVRIQVRDGIPPVVRIDSPRPNQRVRLGGSGLRLSGTVTDNVRVARVQLAIELVASRQRYQTHGACIWYDSHLFLLLSACTAPYFFNAQVRHGRWSFRISPQAKIPAGTYVVRVRGIDRAGNISHFYALRLHTILPFVLR